MIEVNAIFPVMVVQDLKQVKEFYENAFGFQSVFYDAGFYLHMILPDSAVQLGFLLSNHSSQPEFLQTIMNTDGYVISMEVNDAHKAYSEAQSLGLNITMQLKEEVWGQLHFMVQDPAGFQVDIIEHLDDN